jgi:hypothetical protein
MNENQQRHLLSTFQYVDNLLSEAERLMASAGSASLFQEYSQDTTAIQRKVTHEWQWNLPPPNVFGGNRLVLMTPTQ